jgi:hypothetical protein
VTGEERTMLLRGRAFPRGVISRLGLFFCSPPRRKRNNRCSPSEVRYPTEDVLRRAIFIARARARYSAIEKQLPAARE